MPLPKTPSDLQKMAAPLAATLVSSDSEVFTQALKSFYAETSQDINANTEQLAQELNKLINNNTYFFVAFVGFVTFVALWLTCFMIFWNMFQEEPLSIAIPVSMILAIPVSILGYVILCSISYGILYSCSCIKNQYDTLNIETSSLHQLSWFKNENDSQRDNNASTYETLNNNDLS